MTTEAPHPRVGISAIAINEKGQYLAGLRANGIEPGTWGTTGGALEFGESFEACAAREVMEEAGLVLSNIEVLTVSNHMFDKGTKHYASIFCIGMVTGEARRMEPHKCLEWRFCDDWDNFPKPPLVDYSKDVPKRLIEDYKRRHNILSL